AAEQTDHADANERAHGKLSRESGRSDVSATLEHVRLGRVPQNVRQFGAVSSASASLRSAESFGESSRAGRKSFSASPAFPRVRRRWPSRYASRARSAGGSFGATAPQPRKPVVPCHARPSCTPCVLPSLPPAYSSATPCHASHTTASCSGVNLPPKASRRENPQPSSSSGPRVPSG